MIKLFFLQTVAVIEEECFDDTYLTDGATFPMDPIKHIKTRVNKKKPM